MVERGEDHVVADLATVAERDAAVVLKMAAGVDEDSLPHGDVPAEIGVERREDPHRGIDLVSEKPREKRPHLVGRMVGAVELEGDAPRGVAHLIHETADLLRIERTARCGESQKFGEVHRRFSLKNDSIRSKGIRSILS